MTPQPKSAYRLICERECEWCAKGDPKDESNRHWNPLDFVDDFEQFAAEMAKAPLCTAPSRDAVIERQAKEIEGLRTCLSRAREDLGVIADDCTARPATYPKNALNWIQSALNWMQAAMKEEPNAR